VRELDAAAADFRIAQQPLRQLQIALLLELRARELAIGGARVARNEDRLAGGRPAKLNLRKLGVFAGLPSSYARITPMSRHQRGNWKLSGSPPNAAMLASGANTMRTSV
jgi:hypothetical protein